MKKKEPEKRRTPKTIDKLKIKSLFACFQR